MWAQDGEGLANERPVFDSPLACFLLPHLGMFGFCLCFILSFFYPHKAQRCQVHGKTPLPPWGADAAGLRSASRQDKITEERCIAV